MDVGSHVSIEDLVAVGRFKEKVRVSEETLRRIERSRSIVEKIMSEKKTVYGINTGLGDLVNVRLSDEDVDKLQENLVLSHCAGFGDPLDEEIVRGMMFLRAVALAKGYSGVRPIVVERLVDFLNENVVPYVPEKGSVGASGDLSPLAHIASVLIGKGYVLVDGKKMEASEFLKKKNIKPLKLKAKEGLALINGTQAMTSIAGFVVRDSLRLLKVATLVSAMSIDALKGSTTPFDERIHSIRPHPGQIEVASWLRKFLEGSEIRMSHINCPKVQDAYTLRTVPQVYGAILDTLRYTKEVLEREMNSVTDNPLIFEDGDVLSGGNFHGEPVALVSDFVSIALTDLGNMIERRIDRLLNPKVNEGLPPFLAFGKPGLNTGYMIFQYSAAALSNENKVLSHPASADSIPTSAYQEDHVSMGMNSALKLKKVFENLLSILSIEALVSAIAVDSRRPLRSSRIIEDFKEEILKLVEHRSGDDLFWDDFMRVREYLEKIVKGREDPTPDID